MPVKRKLPSKPKRVKAIARERVGTVRPSRLIDERPLRDKPKHKKPITAETTAG